MTEKAGVAEIFRRAGPAYRQARAGLLDAVRLKVMGAIEACRTAVLGGHLYQCDGCGREHPLHNSCRNRHCPTCQGNAARTWLDARAGDILPVPHFHVVFTLPRGIADIAFANRRTVFGILFRTAHELLHVADHRRRPALRGTRPARPLAGPASRTPDSTCLGSGRGPRQGPCWPPLPRSAQVLRTCPLVPNRRRRAVRRRPAQVFAYLARYAMICIGPHRKRQVPCRKPPENASPSRLPSLPSCMSCPTASASATFLGNRRFLEGARRARRRQAGTVRRRPGQGRARDEVLRRLTAPRMVEAIPRPSLPASRLRRRVRPRRRPAARSKDCWSFMPKPVLPRFAAPAATIRCALRAYLARHRCFRSHEISQPWESD